jgi:hypothetical protein
MRAVSVLVLAVSFAASSAHAETIHTPDNLNLSLLPRVTATSFMSAAAACGLDTAARPASPLAISSTALSDAGTSPSVSPAQDPQPLHAAVVEHSDAYRTRAKIHKVASFATLPLFAAEVALGQSLYNTPTNGSTKSAHIAVGVSIMSLFAVNTVTGAWNLFGEDRQEPTRALRLVHGLLMMVSDAGFVATAASGPHHERGSFTVATNASTHRAIALTSIGVGTVGYLIMLFGNH